MGLDVTAYEVATLIDPHEHTDDCYDADHVRAFVYDGFERSLRGLEADRCYLVSGERFPFWAGSYSGYGHFRGLLTRAALGIDPRGIWADPDAAVDLPFYELINFADNEGTIGPEAAADLLADFDEHGERVKETIAAATAPETYYAEKVDAWHEAFRIAAGSGLVRFA